MISIAFAFVIHSAYSALINPSMDSAVVATWDDNETYWFSETDRINLSYICDIEQLSALNLSYTRSDDTLCRVTYQFDTQSAYYDPIVVNSIHDGNWNNISMSIPMDHQATTLSIKKVQSYELTINDTMEYDMCTVSLWVSWCFDDHHGDDEPSCSEESTDECVLVIEMEPDTTAVFVYQREGCYDDYPYYHGELWDGTSHSPFDNYLCHTNDGVTNGWSRSVDECTTSTYMENVCYTEGDIFSCSGLHYGYDDMQHVLIANCSDIEVSDFSLPSTDYNETCLTSLFMDYHIDSSLPWCGLGNVSFIRSDRLTKNGQSVWYYVDEGYDAHAFYIYFDDVDGWTISIDTIGKNDYSALDDACWGWLSSLHCDEFNLGDCTNGTWLYQGSTIKSVAVTSGPCGWTDKEPKNDEKISGNVWMIIGVTLGCSLVCIGFMLICVRLMKHKSTRKKYHLTEREQSQDKSTQNEKNRDTKSDGCLETIL